MRNLRWVGLVSTVLYVGVLGGLMAPLPSEAARTAPAAPPTLTIDGNSITGAGLVFDGPGCYKVDNVTLQDPSYTQCWSITGTNYTTQTNRSSTLTTATVGASGTLWYVGDFATDNQARILIYDTSTTGAVDNMKLTGITLTPASPTNGAGRSVDVVITATFNNNTSNVNDGGNLAGAYKWGLSQGGHVDPWKSVPIPPDTKGLSWDGVSGGESIQNSGLKLTGTMTGPSDCSPSCSLAVLQTYAKLGGPTVPLDTIGYVTQSSTAVEVKKTSTTTNANCDTGTVTRGGVSNVHVCAPTVTYTFTYVAVGKDTLNLTDSLHGSGSSCYDDSYGGIGGWGGLLGGTLAQQRGDGYGGELLSCTDATFTALINDPLDAGVARDIQDGINAGGVAACGSNCIINMVQAKPVNAGALKTFHFRADGPGLCPPGFCPAPFDITTNAAGIGGYTFKDLVPYPEQMGLRKFRLPASTFPNRWELDQITCQSSLNNGTSVFETHVGRDEDRGRVRVLQLGAGDTLTCTWFVRKDP